MSDSTSITSTTSASGTNRVTGLYSGMDINGMVSASLTKEQTRIDNMKKDIEFAGWQKEKYQEMNTLVSDFQKKYFSYSGEFSLLSSSKLNAKTVSVTGSSAVSISASSGASAGSFTVLSATKATTAGLVATRSVMGTIGDDGTITPYTYAEGVNENNATIKQMAGVMGINLTNVKTIKSTDADGNEVTNEYITLNVNGKDIDIDINAGGGDMMAAVNNADAGVKMTYNTLSGKFELEATKSGAEGNFTVTGNDGFFFGANGMFGAAGETVTATGTDATLTIKDDNGDKIKYTESVNSFKKGGFTFTINENFDSTKDGEIKAELGTNEDDMVNKIKTFVEDYNKLIKTLNEEISTKHERSFDPLTKAERKELDDEEYEEYMEKAKKGLLFGDSNIRKLLTNMRSALNSIETESGLSLKDIGISTGNYFTSSKIGELEIDENKLRSAIKNNSDEVVSLFSGTSGIANSMKNLTDNYIDRLEDVTINSINKKVSNYENRLDRLEDLFAKKEDELYSKFAYLETLLSQMDAASSMFYM